MSITRVGEKFKVHHGFDKNGWANRRDWGVYKCPCGEPFVMQCRSEGTTKSCGCLIVDSARKLLSKNNHRKTHGYSNTPTYMSWCSMRRRCYSPTHVEYSRYGARGIVVCKRWKNSFQAFVDDMGERPKGMSIDRINCDGNYEPMNCRWATATEQARNQRRNVVLTITGVSKCVAEWAEHPKAAKDKTIYKRIKDGWSHHEAVFGGDAR